MKREYELVGIYQMIKVWTWVERVCYQNLRTRKDLILALGWSKEASGCFSFFLTELKERGKSQTWCFLGRERRIMSRGFFFVMFCRENADYRMLAVREVVNGRGKLTKSFCWLCDEVDERKGSVHLWFFNFFFLLVFLFLMQATFSVYLQMCIYVFAIDMVVKIEWTRVAGQLLALLRPIWKYCDILGNHHCRTCY